ncbi:hypothetical protein LUZ60_002401 [Juncus effusus]|nr:hypothetical protein LUZ60_002401 [Juncus effusus]
MPGSGQIKSVPLKFLEAINPIPVPLPLGPMVDVGRKIKVPVEELRGRSPAEDELKPGDHIYSWRSGFLYVHHGIYIGDDKVIHFTLVPENGHVFSVSSSFFASSSSHSDTYFSVICLRCFELQQYGRPKKGVTISCLDCFLNGKKLNLFSYSVSGAFFLAKIRGGTCTMAKSNPSHEVIHRAAYLLKHGFGSYDLFKNNSEEFAMYCKTGLVPNPFENTGRSGQINSLKFAVVRLHWPNF